MHGILSTVKNSGRGRESVTNPHKHKYCKITQILQVQIGSSSVLSSRSVRVPIRPYRPPMVRLCFLRAVGGCRHPSALHSQLKGELDGYPLPPSPGEWPNLQSKG